MRLPFKIILFLLCAGLVYWLLDSVTHLLFTPGSDLWDILAGNGALHELYHRVLILSVITVSAIFFFRLLDKQRKIEVALNETMGIVQAERDKARRYLDVAGVIIMVQDTQSRVMTINKKGCEVLGYPEHEILGKDWFEHFIPVPWRNSYRDRFNAQVSGTGGAPETYEGEILLKNGETRIIDWHTVLVRVPRENSLHVLSSGEDLTGRKHAENALNALYEESLQASRLKSDLLAFANHELKTPLVPIIGWADFIKSGLEKGQKLDDLIGKEEITSIQNAAYRLLRIIDNFLEMGRIESDKSRLQVDDHPVKEILKGALNSIMSLAHERHTQVNDDSDNARVHVDAFRIEQAFTNILSNALKYSPETSEIRITSKQTDSHYIIMFRDQGEGFTREELKSTWKPFSPLRRINFGGQQHSSGIGLYLTKNIIEQNEGTIEISSGGRGQGTTVTLSLPLSKSN